MTAILAIFGEHSGPADIRGLLGTMAYRGSEVHDVFRCPGAVLAVARDRWETQPEFAGETMIASRGDIHVVCDATLYYKADLLRQLKGAGVIPASHSSADLIAAAYEAFGAECVNVLEGDFSFYVWDAKRRQLFCGRDPFGARSTFHARIDGQLFVASTPHPMLARMGPAAKVCREGVLRAILMRYGDGTVTPWEGISELPAGSRLYADSAGVRVERYWEARGADHYARLTTDEARATLRELLDAACAERAVPQSTALAMSGGYDSTAVFSSLASAAGAIPHILSFALPDGDPGDESPYITAVADSYGTTVNWVEITGVPLYIELERRCRTRSHCHGHTLEIHNRVLARRARTLNARVLLNGHGGDNVFALESWRMADLLRRGRLVELRRYRAARGYRGWRSFVDTCLRPALPLRLFDAMEHLLGRRLCTRPFERPVPPWICVDGVTLDRVVESDRRDYAARIVRRYPTISMQRHAWNLMEYAHSRGCAASFDLNRDEGLELRMPFYDRRLVEFAMSRPDSDFNQPNDFKVLLKQAVRDRLPDRNRTFLRGGMKTGTGFGILRARWRKDTERLLADLNAGPWVSQEAGVVDSQAFNDVFGPDGVVRWSSSVDVSLTILCEAWLRAYLRPASGVADPRHALRSGKIGPATEPSAIAKDGMGPWVSETDPGGAWLAR